LLSSLKQSIKLTTRTQLKIFVVLILLTVILLSCFSVIVDRKSMSNNIANLVKQAEVSELEASLTSEKSVYTLAENIRLNWKLTNKVNEDILLVSHYVTPQGNHYDNLQLRVIGEGQREPILIPLSTARYATAKIVCLLKPGKSLSHTLNLTDWLRLKNIELGSGHFDITATYQVTEKERSVTNWIMCDEVNQEGEFPQQWQTGSAQPVWHGIVESNKIQINILDEN